MNQKILKIHNSNLGVSEPEPSWFGNPPNEKNNQNWTNKNWLKSRFHFNFAEYTTGPNNFGVLRVMNDDLVQPQRGFGAHPHRNVEICTYIVHGELTHQDSMGSKETLGRGAVQFMSAGTGVQHSEHNLNEKAALRFIQIWINTREINIKPNYGSLLSDEQDRKNKFYHMVSDIKDEYSKTGIKIHQDANIYVSVFTEQVDFEVNQARNAYLIQIEGESVIKVDDFQVELEQHDAARIYGPAFLKLIPGSNGSHVLIVEMKN